MPLTSMSCSHAVAGLMAMCLLVSSSVSAIGCGGAFLLAIMFQKYPEAAAVSAAVRQAREVGTLQGDEWPGIGVQSLHSWRADKVSNMVEALEHRLNSVAGPLGDIDGVHVFLINEFVWMEIRRDSDQVIVRKAPSSPREEAPKVFATRRVFDALLDQSITWQEAVDNGFIAARCVDGCRGAPLAVLGRVFSVWATAS